MFRGRLRSCQPLRHIYHWISRKLLEIEAWFQRPTNRKWHMGYQKVTWPMTSRQGQTRDLNTLKVQYLENSWRWYLATIANVLLDSLLWGSTVGYASDSLLGLLLKISQKYTLASVWYIKVCLSQNGKISFSKFPNSFQSLLLDVRTHTFYHSVKCNLLV